MKCYIGIPFPLPLPLFLGTVEPSCTCPLNAPLPLPLEALPPDPPFSFVVVPSKTSSTIDPETTSPETN